MADAPELDKARYAPELWVDRSARAPEVMRGNAPEVDYDRLAPQVQPWDNEESKYSVVTYADKPLPIPGKRVLGLSKRKRWIAIAVGLILVIAIALGVGVGVGVRRNDSRKPSPSVGAPADPAATTTVSGIGPSSTPVPEIAAHSIRNETSLASVSTSDGNRHIFFQDQSGNIRQALYSNSTKSWSAATSFVVTSEARNNTPITAITQNGGSIVEQIHLFYVAPNDTIVTSQFDGGWTSAPMHVTGTPSVQLTLPQNSRALSVSEKSNDVEYMAVMFLEKSGGGVAVLNGTRGPDSGFNSETVDSLPWAWHDITSDFEKSMPSGVSMSVPFTSITRWFGEPDEDSDGSLTVEAGFLNGDPNAAPSFMIRSTLLSAVNDAELVNQSFATPGIPSTPLKNPPASIFASDLVLAADNPDLFTSTLMGLWVNGTTLATWDDGRHRIGTVPSAPFPFPRLATTTPINSTTFYLYHQINGTTLVEEAWNDRVGGWEDSRYFDVGTGS